jgi:hypothetical protein
MRNPDPAPRRSRLWPVLLPSMLFVALAIVWTGLWFYAADAAEKALDGWRVREARVGRIHRCDQQTIGGYPFRIEFRCTNPVVELRRESPPVAFQAADLVVVAQVYQPTRLVSEFTGPMTVGQPGGAPGFVANWTLGQSSVSGKPFAPDRISIAVDNPTFDRIGGAGHVNLLKASHVELHGRLAETSTPADPAVDLVLRLVAATAPELHELAARPLDADVAATLHGLPDLAPKPWPVRFKELQARGGKIEIAKARIQQGDVIAVGAGTLGLTARGGLDGQMQITVVGIETILKSLDLERIMSEGDIGATLGRLDRIMPGLSQIARRNAGPSIMAGLGAIGEQTTLEGKPAVTVPLRFTDGQIFLGPLAVGRAAPLF